MISNCVMKRGRKKTTDAPADTRKVFKNERIESDGNVFHFDGKTITKNPKIIKVYKFHGDIMMMEKAFQDFCLSNGYDSVIITFQC